MWGMLCAPSVAKKQAEGRRQQAAGSIPASSPALYWVLLGVLCSFLLLKGMERWEVLWGG